MPVALLRMIAVIVVCLCDGALAVVSAQPRHAPGAATARSSDAPLRASRVKHHAARMPVAVRDGYVNPAAPYKANRLSLPRASEPILNIPGQTTVLTREVLDDMNATSVKGGLRSIAGVTIGR